MIGDPINQEPRFFQATLDWDEPITSDSLNNLDSKWKEFRKEIDYFIKTAPPLLEEQDNDIRVHRDGLKNFAEDFLYRSKKLGRQIHHKGERLRLRRLAEDIAEGLRQIGAGIYNPDLAQPDPLGQLPKQPYHLHHLPPFSPYFTNRTSELAELMQAWREKSARIIQLIGPGGVGKSLLVRHWLQKMVPELEKRKVEIFCWSFESRGFTEEMQEGEEAWAIEDLFIDRACRFFCLKLTKKEEANIHTKAQKLLHKLEKRKTPFIIILDGFEAELRQNHGRCGEITNPVMWDFLDGLLNHPDWRGLCVITTRREVVDLEGRQTVKPIKINKLIPSDSIELLQRLGVISAENNANDLAEAAEYLEYHPLSLTVLAACLIKQYGGEAKYWREAIPNEPEEFDKIKELPNGNRLERMFRTYANSLEKTRDGKTNISDLAELQLLGLLSLFKRSCYFDEIEYLLQPPKTIGFTDHLNTNNFPQAINSLQEQSLLEQIEELITTDTSDSSGGQYIDKRNRQRLALHPLVREYFANHFKSKYQEGWRTIHGRIYQLLLNSVTHPPETLAETTPLYEAIYHGCESGQCLNAYFDVYLGKLHRIHDKNHYPWTRLGAYSSDLVALASFFAKDNEPWTRVRPEFLNTKYESELYFAAGICLRALGRLDEATPPLLKSIDLYQRDQKYAPAAYAASAYAELAWTQGKLNEAKRWAITSLDLLNQGQESVNRRPDIEFRDMRRSRVARIAEACFQLGKFSEALADFKKAESLQQEIAEDEQFPWENGRIYLYTVSGYYFHDFLLYLGEALADGWISTLAELELDWSEFTTISHPNTPLQPSDPGILQALTESQRQGIQLIQWVMARSVHTIKWAEERGRLLDIGQQYLISGRARMLFVGFAENNRRDLYRESSMDISQAMQKLEEAGQRQEIPQGYLVRAQLRRRLGNYPGAERDLAEAERLAKRSGLTALRCDIAFEKAWLALRQGQFDFANTHFEQAKQDVDRMEYHCRYKELVALEIRLKNSQTSL